jgi:hypothetical protein
MIARSPEFLETEVAAVSNPMSGFIGGSEDSPNYPTPYRDDKGRFARQPTDAGLHDEATGEQNPGHGMFHPGLSSPFMPFLFSNGGSMDNPMAFPGYNALYTGTYRTYRWMLQHPTIRLVRAISCADILCNRWEYVKVGKGISDEWATAVQDQMDPLRFDLLHDFFVRGRDFGWQSGEIIWEIRDSMTWLTRMKPLLVDITECLRDEKGNFSGVINFVPDAILNPDKHVVRLAAPYRAWKYTYDAEAGYLYGRSWLENLRMTVWRDWLSCDQQLERLGAKITGIQLILTSPSGTFPTGKVDSNGKPEFLEYRKVCEHLIRALANGSPGAWLPSLNIPTDPKGNINTAKIIAELATKAAVTPTLLNHGSTTPAIEGILKRMMHAEDLMFEGSLRSPRSGGRGQGGKSDTEELNEVGASIAQLEDQGFARQCQPLVDAILVLNFGEEARGKIRIQPPSIVDNKRGYMKAMILAAMNDPIIAREMLRIINMKVELNNMDIQTTGEYDPERVEKADEKQQLNTNKQPDPQGGRPTNGNGNPKTRPGKAQQRRSRTPQAA